VEPTISSLRRESSDEFILIACDGVWDVMSCVEAVGWVQRCLAREMSSKPKRSQSSPSAERRGEGSANSGPIHAAHALERTCAQLLVECMAKGSCDNMSVVLIIPAQVGDAGTCTPPDVESEPPTPTDSDAVSLVAAETVACAVKLGMAEASAALNPPKHMTRMKRSMTILSASLINDNTTEEDNDVNVNSGELTLATQRVAHLSHAFTHFCRSFLLLIQSPLFFSCSCSIHHGTRLLVIGVYCTCSIGTHTSQRASSIACASG
jgi:hypothetical protein